MPLYGPDTSDYQTSLPEADFNIIKATEGVTWRSDRFPGWRDELERRGVPRFFYHFGHPARNDPRGEADALAAYVGALRPGEGIALDYENPPNDAERDDFYNLSNAQHEAWIVAWLDRVEEHYPSLKDKVLFYSYMGLIGSVGTFKVYGRMPLWIAGYGTNNGQEQPQRVFGTTTLPTTVDRWGRYTIWQYTSQPIDWNRADVTLDELRALTHQGVTEPIPTPSPPENPHVTSVPNQFVLVAVHSRLVLDAQGASTENGTTIMQHPVHAQGNQRWVMESVTEGGFRLRGAASGRVLDVVGDGRENGSRLQLWHWHGGPNQRWSLEPVNEHQARIVSVSADKVLDIEGLKLTGGAALQIWERNGGPNQLWEAVWAESEEAAELVTPPPPPAPTYSFSVQDAIEQIAAWNFYDGVKGFQVTAGIKADGAVGAVTVRSVQLLIERAGQLSANFHLNEFRCSHCGRALAHPSLIDVLQSIRDEVGPMGKYSSFRCREHPIEAAKSTPGQHESGRAWDPSPNFAVSVAEQHGAVGIGYAAADSKRCTHLDTRAGQRVYFLDN